MWNDILERCNDILFVLKDFCYDMFSFFFTEYEFKLATPDGLVTYNYNGLEICFVMFAITVFVRLVYGVIKSVVALN